MMQLILSKRAAEDTGDMQKIRIDMDLGNNLRRMRLENDFTQDRLVAQLNLMGVDISKAIYSRYETGELNVPVSVLVALHCIYGCAYDKFFENLDAALSG